MPKKSISWGWVIFWLIIFWPIGLFLVIRKLATDKSALMSGKTGAISAVAWFLIVFGGLGFLGAISDETTEGSVIVVLILFIVGGVLLLRKAKQIKKTAAKYKKYIDLVVNQNVRSIDNIASTVGLSYDMVLKELQDMIDIGYLKDAYINMDSRTIEFKQFGQQAFTPASNPGQASGQTTTVRCSGCGANNVVVVGMVTECEYCGNPISAKSDEQPVS